MSTGLRAGYKQTEVGVIPEDWDVKSMDSLTNLMTNGFVGIATSAYVDSDDGVLYVQGYNVQANGFNFHGIKRVAKSFHARHQKSCLREGDLLTIQTGDIGVTTMVPPELVGANCHALVISRFVKSQSDPSFYCRYLNSERGRSQLREIETGSTMKHLNVGDMKQVLLPAPPVEEQRAIASALSDVDALLGGLDRLIAKKQGLKVAAMQQLLTGQTRLPGFSGAWEVVKAGDIGRFQGGSGFPVRFQGATEGEYPLFKVSDMNNVGNETFMETANNYISESLRKQLGATAFPAGSIVFAKVGAAVFLERKKILNKASSLDNVSVRSAPSCEVEADLPRSLFSTTRMDT
ncbi:MAG: restriction endonuclease subunit S [Rhodoferax sp.]|nr:restriction endonuclease subunit S [Rhodoferax sp.]MDP3650676.1 restriction endonuclease subunit S [Rhodoferax sp.]